MSFKKIIFILMHHVWALRLYVICHNFSKLDLGPLSLEQLIFNYVNMTSSKIFIFS